MPLFLPPVVFPPPPDDHVLAQVKQVPFYDIQWNRPVFRPPSLPTQAQIWSDLPFTARFPLKDFQHK